MYTKKNIVSTNDACASSFKGNKGVDLDDSTFNMWKTELEKELPNFWDSMTSGFKRR